MGSLSLISYNSFPTSVTVQPNFLLYFPIFIYNTKLQKITIYLFRVQYFKSFTLWMNRKILVFVTYITFCDQIHVYNIFFFVRYLHWILSFSVNTFFLSIFLFTTVLKLYYSVSLTKNYLAAIKRPIFSNLVFVIVKWSSFFLNNYANSQIFLTVAPYTVFIVCCILLILFTSSLNNVILTCDIFKRKLLRIC